MILEVAVLNVKPGESADFEVAFSKAQSIISSMKGYLSHELQRCIESSDQYLLLVRWETLKDHTEGFRNSRPYQDWKELLHHFYSPFPTVEHYEAISGLSNSTHAVRIEEGNVSELATGHCLCGDVTFEYRGELGGASYCHCEDCRRHTGSAFNVVVGVPADQFQLTGAVPASFTKRGDSGREITRHFCPRCGSPVYGSSPTLPNRIYIKAGALDDPSKVVVTHQSWFACATTWAFISPELQKFDRAPKQ